VFADSINSSRYKPFIISIYNQTGFHVSGFPDFCSSSRYDSGAVCNNLTSQREHESSFAAPSDQADYLLVPDAECAQQIQETAGAAFRGLH
jgi:Pyruvate/2-oxoacid:ferredoxin oxidoreductase gamma subunit